MYDETLVYLLREAKREGNENLVDLIYLILMQRANAVVWKYSFLLPYDRFEEGRQEVHLNVFRKISDLETSTGDFAQVRFKLFVKREAATIFRRIMEEQRREYQMIPLDDDRDDAVPFEIPNRGLDPEQRTLLQGCLELVPEPMRRALRLFIAGWKIESRTHPESTLSSFFGVTPRAIRNWLRKAWQLMRECLGGAYGR